MEKETVVSYKTCPLCEATCGLEIHTVGKNVVDIRGDKLDPLSKGYLCPKGYSLKELHDDPDRIRKPMIREGTLWREVSWTEAFREAAKGLRSVREKYGSSSLGVYIGNPSAHTLAGQLYFRQLVRSLGTKNVFSASTMDQVPKHLAAELMFGDVINIPVPDIDRTDYLMIIGANPLVSNGSMMTAPNMRKRIKDLQNRGGKFVVIDPVKTITAQQADVHHMIRPGTDALFLLGIVHTLFKEELISLERLAHHVNGVEEVRKAASDFSPEAVSSLCEIEADDIREVARDMAASPKAAVYGRMGTCTQLFGTVTTWLINVINTLTGNLDREGGVMFTNPVTGGVTASSKRRKEGSIHFGRFHSRTRSVPEVLGELPVNTMADEIENPGEGQVKGLLSFAGNPALSAPNSRRLQKALGQLDFMVSIDIYLNETTRNANVIFPAPSPLEKEHYDLALYKFSVRNISNYSKSIFSLPSDMLNEWEIILHLMAELSDEDLGKDPVEALDTNLITAMVTKEVKKTGSPIFEYEAEEILEELSKRKGPSRLLDFLIRVGPYGDHFGRNPEGLTLAYLEEHPHGVDLGPLKPRIPEVLLTPSGKVELAPELIVRDIERLRQKCAEGRSKYMLIGRRDLRSNNSWMHNLQGLVKGKDRCTLWLHTKDAQQLGLSSGDRVKVISRTGELQASAEINDNIMPGVISLPHGWGHLLSGTRMETASKHAGVNMNILTDDLEADLSGNAVLNGIPVVLEPISN